MVATVGFAAVTDNADTINVPWTKYGTSDPIEIADGDVGILAWNGQSSPTWTPPSGWDLAAPEVIGTTGSHRSRVYVRALDGTEDASSIALAASGINKMTGILAVYRGVDTTDIIDAIASRDETSTGTTHANPQITTVADDAPVVTIIHERLTDSSTAYTAPTGYIKRVQPTPVGGGGSASGALADDGLAVTRAGGTDVTPPDWTNGASTNNVITWTISLTPLAGTPSGTGTITATSAMAGVGTKTGAGTGGVTATSALSGAGAKHASGTGSITATSAMAGTGRGETPGPGVELNLAGTWTDVKPYVRYSDAVKITRGQKSEGRSSLDNSTCDLTLDNSDGRFSPRKPTSPYYGKLGRNTPIRVSLPYGSSYMRAAAAEQTGASATCPDDAGFDVTDLDVRVDVDAFAWGEGDLCGRYTPTSDERSWWFGIDGNGAPRLLWSPDGTLASRTGVSATEPVPAGAGRLALRVTLDVDNGSSGYTATFYTSTSIDGTWTQLGDQVTGTATTTVYASTSGLEVGDVFSITGPGVPGYYLGFQLLDGIGGDVVAEADFTALDAGDTGFTDSAGNTWTIGDAAAVDDRLYRFHGEVAEWPPKRDISGKDATVSIKAAGISRRLKQGQATLRSPMYREFSNPARENIIAYWPMEDGKEATQVASSGGGVPPAVVSGTPTLGDYDGWTATDPVPTMATGAIAGSVPASTSTGEISIRLFVFAAAGSVTAETSLLHVRTTGTVAVWDVRITSGGNLRTRAYDPGGTSLLDDTSVFTLSGRGFTILDLELSQDGSDIDWRTLILDFTNTDTINDTVPINNRLGTVTGQTLGVPQLVTVGRNKGLTGVKVGHLVVANDISAYLATGAAIAAHNGEDPIDRMIRLCTEEEVAFTPVVAAPTGNTVTMGDQLNKSLVDLLQEAADADGGILHETRDQLGFGYRTRMSMYNQPAALTLSCADHELNEALAPTDDDKGTFNDITAKREAGSEVRVTQTTGPLSTATPENGGVGPYDTKVTLSLEDDGQLADQAGWRLHLGTVNESRYPKVQVHLASNEFTDELRAAALAVDVGDRIVITDPSDDLPPDDISQIVIGYSETIDQFEHVITYVCQPESPWRVGQVEAAGFDRVDTGGSTLAADATSSATSLSVASDGQLWTTSNDDLPMDVFVAGERVTVTAVSGTSSPQTFTVTRSVNGVEKALSSGDAVTIAAPVAVAL